MKKNTFKTLLFSDLYPLPENIGTRMRTMNFVRFFNKIGEVDLVYRRTGSENHAGRGPFRREIAIGKRNIAEGKDEFPRIRDIRERIRRLADRRPWIVADWPQGSIEELNAVVRGDHYDYVLCRYAQDSYPFLGFHQSLRKKVIVDFDDVMSMSIFEAKFPRPPSLYGGMKWRLQRKMLLSYQKRFLKFGAVLFCSDEDRKEVAGTTGSSNAHVVPNTYPAMLKVSTPDGSGYENRRTLLFVGALDYGPNIAGLNWFVQSIFPKVREVYRDVRLLVVGRRPPENLVRACLESPGIEVHRDVPDVGPFYEMCGAVVVPLLTGGGTRIKILEAAMAGRPVFSTPIGAHGLASGAGLHLNLFSDDGSFIERYGDLDEENLYRECVLNTHAAVQKAYSPEAFERAMREVIEAIRRETMESAALSSTDG